MLKILKNQNGFMGLMGLIIATVVIGIMSAMILPTFTARMNYKQAKYTVGVIRTIENAENAYMAKNNSFADLTTLANQGYLSSNFLQSVQGGSYPQPNWLNTQIANQPVNVCIDNGYGCPNNPGVGNNGYFIGIYGNGGNLSEYRTYIEHELPGSGSIGTQYISYVAPVPSSPPVASANYANSAGNANYANTAGYANSSGLPAWSQEQAVGVGQSYGFYNKTDDTLYVTYNVCSNYWAFAFVSPGGQMPQGTHYVNAGRGFCVHSYSDNYIASAYSG
jgi:type II secretory pathway pseudopilin PulG